jgi:23S rRNA (uracil1939-C5)-methyltransferase
MKNEQIKVKCIDLDEEGKGIIEVRGKKISVPNLMFGETVIVEIFQRKGETSAKIIQIVEGSKSRVSPKCTYYDKCGGCQLQHMNTVAQADFKQRTVEKLLKKYHSVNKIISMKEPYYYRNKVHSTVVYDIKKNIVSGIYEENSHRVTPVDECITQDENANKIINSIIGIMKVYKMKPYSEDSGEGFLRHILIKTGFESKQIMVVLVVASQIFPGKNNFVKLLLKKHPEIATIVMNINNQKTSMILGNTEKVLYGTGYIEDTLCGCVFQISPKSFYQINPIQTEILYKKAISLAQLSGKETVLDAYCGIGTISLIISDKAKSVMGVELNKEAIKDAIKNAKRNNIANVIFYNDDAGEFMKKLVAEKTNVDVVFMDPPRSGSDERFLAALIELNPKRIVYISCNPVTQERDLKYLTQNKYEVKEIQPVDMFPQTYHVETVVSIERK